MRFYSVKRDVALTTRYGYRRLRPPPPGPEIAVADIVLAAPGEAEHVQKAMDIQAARDARLPLPADDVLPEATPDLRFYAEAQLLSWPFMPMRLGRLAFDGSGGSRPVLIDDPAPLPAQLVALRARRPGRRHFRIAIVNGFGGNLGDTMLGAAAWRAALQALREGLPSLSADVLLGPSVPPAAAALIGHEDGIGEVLFAGPTLQQFARYDAFFDFSDLIELPRFHQNAHVDWVIWWLGLDPATIPDADKRCRVHLPAATHEWARDRLAARPAPTVAFVWRASVPLRSMPDEVAVRFAQALLEAAPGVTLVTDRTLKLEHVRIADLGDEADSPERMMALVAQSDGLITVDSLAQHVADAADVPTVMLLATLPPARFPYYPNMAIVTPEGMDSLPGWGVTKLSEAAFAPMQDDYARAWEGVSPAACWRLLETRMASREQRPESGARTGPEWDRAVKRSLAGASFPHDRPHPIDAGLDAELARIAGLVLAPGSTAILACGDSQGLASTLARLVAPNGALHVLEPRRLRAQKLAAEVLAAGLDTLHIHPALAGPRASVLEVIDFDPANESDPAEMGNVSSLTRVAAVKLDTLVLDALALSACRLLILRPPQDAVGALEGAHAMLRDLRPLVLLGSIRGDRLGAAAALLAPLDYKCAVGWASRDGEGVALGIATPVEALFHLAGFEDIEPKNGR